MLQVDISSFLHFAAKSAKKKNNEKSPISGKNQYFLHCNIKIKTAFTLRTYKASAFVSKYNFDIC